MTAAPYLRRAGFYLLLGLILFYAAFPFYWAIVSSLKTGEELLQPTLVPAHPTLDNYRALFNDQPFLRNVLNSLVVASGATLLSLALALFAAYAFARIRFRGRKPLLLTVLGVSMFPQIAVLSGMYELITALGLYNRLSGLILANLMLTLPFTVWTLTVFMREVAVDIEDAAAIDGAGPFRIVTTIFLPMMAPAMIATGLLAFIIAWNEFLFALTFTLSAEQRTVPVAIALISGATAYELPWGRIMAASVIVALPLVAIVLALQRRIVSGLAAGALKG